VDSYVRLVTQGTAPGKRTVNVVTSLAGYAPYGIQQCVQVTAAQAAAQPNNFETLQVATVANPLFKTIYVAGYTAPN